MATRKTAATKTITVVVDPLHGLAVDRARTRALAEVKLVFSVRQEG